jgi:hypothetical protein
MGTDYNHEVGYESLLVDFRRYQGQAPKGVSLQNKRGKTIILRFKVGDKFKSPGCNCSFTLDGMVEALSKAHKVAEKLKASTSETEFEQWYESEILEKNAVANDQLTFAEAIAVVEEDFWARPSRTGRVRDKNCASDRDSLYRTYGCFYMHLPGSRIVNLVDILKVIDKQKKGTRNKKYAVSAMRKLAMGILCADSLRSKNIGSVCYSKLRQALCYSGQSHQKIRVKKDLNEIKFEVENYYPSQLDNVSSLNYF